MSLPMITVVGNVQRIETKQAGDKQLTTLTVACGDKNKKGEWDNLYIDAEFWGDASNFVSTYFKEGSAISVEGKLYTSSYIKGDGTKVYQNKFLFPKASFVPKDKESNSAPSAPSQPAPSQPAPSIPEIQFDVDESELPF